MRPMPVGFYRYHGNYSPELSLFNPRWSSGEEGVLEIQSFSHTLKPDVHIPADILAPLFLEGLGEQSALSITHNLSLF